MWLSFVVERENPEGAEAGKGVGAGQITHKPTALGSGLGCERKCHRNLLKEARGFTGGQVVRTVYFHCREHGFNPCLGNLDSISCVVLPKKERKQVSQWLLRPHMWNLEIGVKMSNFSYSRKTISRTNFNLVIWDQGPDKVTAMDDDVKA